MNFQTKSVVNSDFQHQETQKYKENEEQIRKYSNELEENLKKALGHPLQAANVTSIDGDSEMRAAEYI